MGIAPTIQATKGLLLNASCLMQAYQPQAEFPVGSVPLRKPGLIKEFEDLHLKIELTLFLKCSDVTQKTSVETVFIKTSYYLITEYSDF